MSSWVYRRLYRSPMKQSGVLEIQVGYYWQGGFEVVERFGPDEIVLARRMVHYLNGGEDDGSTSNPEA